MSNHLHLVLRNRPDLVQQWTDGEVALRWLRLFPRRDEVTGSGMSPTTTTWRCHGRCRPAGERYGPAGQHLLVHEVLERMGRQSGQSRGGLAGDSGPVASNRSRCSMRLRFWRAASMSISTRSGPGSRPRQRNRTSRRVVTASGASQKGSQTPTIPLPEGARHPPFRCQGSQTPGARHPPFPHHSAASSGSQTPTIPLPATIGGARHPPFRCQRQLGVRRKGHARQA